MQEWMIAMFVVGIFWILRNMAKIVLMRKDKGQEIRPIAENPQKEKMDRYADSFQKLAGTFYNMPFQVEKLGKAEVEGVLGSMQNEVCVSCSRCEVCWQQQYYLTYSRGEELLEALESNEYEKIVLAQGNWLQGCVNGAHFIERLKEEFRRARQERVWNNRLIENRMVVAEQLSEVAALMKKLSDELYRIDSVPAKQEEQVVRLLRRKDVIVKQMWMVEKDGQHPQIFITMRARGGACVTFYEIGQILSKFWGKRLRAAKESRNILKGEYTTVVFSEDVKYQMLYGAAKVTKEKETVSGDNFACTAENGRFVMCLSDGMGSGLDACRESETVVDLAEQFVNSGFSGRTAARLINSALVLQRYDGMFSTVDICSVDLYTGVCEFLKAGAATTFIRRNNWVESITSTSMAAGLVQQTDFDISSKKLYDGDYLVMVTDGVLDALPTECAEETMKEILLQLNDATPKEFGRMILERVMSFCDYRAADDMTVLVAGIWKNS